MARKRFPRTQRLSRAADISAVRQTGRRVRAGHLDVRVATSPLAFARVGIVVPKYSRTIVERNRLKRRLRELARVRLLPVVKPCDILIRTLPKTYEMSFNDLARNFERAVERIVAIV